jgi:UDP-glucuronate 4-epimerase
MSVMGAKFDKVLVTGAAGFIGSHLAERLATAGHPVEGVDCLTDYYDIGLKRANLEAIEAAGCHVTAADLATADLLPLLSGIDVVFHLAGQPGIRASWGTGFESYVRHNVVATQRLLEACRSADIRRLVFASSSSVYGNAPKYPTSENDLPQPHSPYGVTKLAAELLCLAYERNFALPTVLLRYFSVYGPRQRPDMGVHRLIDAALTGRTFPLYGDGRQVRDMTYVEDVVRATLLAAAVDLPAGTVINVAGGAATSMIDLIGAVERIAGSSVPMARHPDAPGDVAETGGSTELAHAALGWRPQTSLLEGLALQIAWHRDRLRAQGA